MIVKLESVLNPLLGTLSYEGDNATEYTKGVMDKLIDSYGECFSKNMDIPGVYQKNTNKNPINLNWG